MCLEDLLDVADVLCGTGEGSSDKVDVLRQTELNILTVLIGNELHVQLDARYVDGLAVGERAAVERLAHNVGAVLDLLNLECNQTVIDQDAGARLNVVRQAFVGDGNDGVVTLDIAGGQRKLDLAVLIGLGTDLRTLGIQHNADRHAQLLAGCLNGVHASLVLLMRAVAEVHTGNIHACLDHLGQYGISCGTKRADNLRFAHRNIFLSITIWF